MASSIRSFLDAEPRGRRRRGRGEGETLRIQKGFPNSSYKLAKVWRQGQAGSPVQYACEGSRKRQPKAIRRPSHSDAQILRTCNLSEKGAETGSSQAPITNHPPFLLHRTCRASQATLDISHAALSLLSRPLRLCPFICEALLSGHITGLSDDESLSSSDFLHIRYRRIMS